jgi:5-carboxymethyl-2-hydroxymuconate isomerase
MKSAHVKNSDEKIPIGKIVCIGRNYAEHAKELGNKIPTKPVIFLKPSSSIIYSGEEVIHPKFSDELHHEVELVLLIGKEVKNTIKEEAEKAIIGYGVGLDMTLRDIQEELRKNGDPWTAAKCFDTSAVISDFTLKRDYQLKLDEKIELNINGKNRQIDTLSSMIFKPSELVEYISSVMTLEKGDLVFTGTPSGVSKVERGDTLIGKIEGIGNLKCRIG